MNRKAIREDGMPGGRNKSIGPVTLNDEEIDRVLNGTEFELERQIEAQQQQLAIGGPGGQPALPSISQPNQHPALHGTPTTLMSALTTMTNQTNQSQASLSLSSLQQQHQQQTQSASNLAQIMYHHQSQQANQVNAMRNQFGVTMPRPSAPVIQAPLSAHQNEDDPVGDIIRLEDKSEPSSLSNANQKYETITTQELLQLLGRTADELMSRQIMWVKNLPFFEDLSVKDYTTLLINTWAESMLLAALTIHRQSIFDNLAQVTDRYTPAAEDCRISENSNEMELIQRINDMFNKFVLLDISHEEFCIMKLINFLNHDITGLQEPVKVEALNKRFWFLCQHWLAARQGPQQRFRDLITSIPDIRLVASKLKKVPSDKISFLFKAVLQTCRISNTRMQIQQQQHQQQQQQQSLQQNMLNQQAPNQR
jgi:germ cell nuclear factor